MTTANILAFGSLEEFQQAASALQPVCVEGVVYQQAAKSHGDYWLSYRILITNLRPDGNIAACLLEVGGCWKLFHDNSPHHDENLKRAEALVEDYLKSKGLTVDPGIWNPHEIMEQPFKATTDLWTFQDKKLVPTDQAKSGPTPDTSKTP